MISHPQALAQCNSYLKSNDLVGEAAYDTAGSAKLIAEGGMFLHVWPTQLTWADHLSSGTSPAKCIRFQCLTQKYENLVHRNGEPNASHDFPLLICRFVARK